MQSPRGQQENPSQAEFCLECGARLALICPQCSTALSCLERQPRSTLWEGYPWTHDIFIPVRPRVSAVAIS